MVVVSKGESGVRHIGVNAQLLTLDGNYRGAGIHSYIHNLLHHLPEADPTFFYTAFVGDRRCVGLPGIERRLTRLPTHRPAVRIVWEQMVQPWAMRRAGVDLIHGPAFVGPQTGGCPFVVTVHDLSFLLYPQGFRALNRFYLRTFTRLSVRHALRVIAVSESTRQDLIRHYDLSPAKIDVVYNGVDASFRPLPNDRVSAFRAARDLPERFILFVGTLEPRKNVVRLIEAYAQLPPGRPPLMLVGGKGWLYDEIFARVKAGNLASEVQFVGYIPAEELPLWYNAADLFVYPSLYEGFGLPPLEAMACGTPVVVSRASSLPEVVGQAGLLVDPTDVEALAIAMRRVLAEREEWEEMRAAGLAQARGFSWQTTASRTVDSYRRALNPGGGEKVV
jgi:glycosyltransferase involved in cell wall biosynthesis